MRRLTVAYPPEMRLGLDGWLTNTTRSDVWYETRMRLYDILRNVALAVNTGLEGLSRDGALTDSVSSK